MIFRYKRKRLYWNLSMGLLWTGLGVLNLLLGETVKWNDFVFLVIGVIYLCIWMYENQRQYLTIRDGNLKVNLLFERKNIVLNEIEQIEKSEGTYVLKTNNKELTINAQIMDPKSLIDLDIELEKLNAEWN